MICPKCKYERKESDTEPDWICPKCGVALEKYAQIMADVEQQKHGLRKEELIEKFAGEKLHFAILLLIPIAILGFILSGLGKYANALFWFLCSGWAFYNGKLMLALGYFNAVPYASAVSKEAQPLQFKVYVTTAFIGSILAAIVGVNCLVS